MSKQEMGNIPEQEKLLNDSPNSKKKGGIKTLPFIIVNESCERLASYGLIPNMIVYVTTFYHMEAAPASILLSIWSILSNGLAVVGAFLSDSYLGRFRALAIGTTCSFIGMLVFWLTTIVPQFRPSPCSQSEHDCEGTTGAQLAILVGSFGAMSIGSGFVRPCSIAFGADQLYDKDNPNNERVLDSFFNWFYVSVGIATVLSSTLCVYIQDHYGWRIGFGFPAALMILAVISFVLGSPLYIKEKPGGSLFTGLFQAAAAAYRKRHIDVDQLNCDDDCYYKEPPSKILAPSTDFKWLNRACIIEDPERELKPDGTALDRWSLCTAREVEMLKAFFRVVPIWSTSLLLLMAMGQYQYLIFQANTMDRHIFPNFEIPSASIGTFTVIAMSIWIPFYDRILVPRLAKFTGIPTGLSNVVRMGIGLALACVASALSAIVETVRRCRAIDAGFEDDPTGVIDMSAMWFLLQFGVMGLAEAFNVVGMIEFIYGEFPKSMSSFAAALYTTGLGLAGVITTVLISVIDSASSAGGNTSWLATNPNRGHLDYYYWTITGLCVVNFFYFLVICRFCVPEHEGKSVLFLDEEDDQSGNRIRFGA